MKNSDLQWAAGFLDGEGTFRGNKVSGTAIVRAGQKDAELLLRLQSLFGGGICECRSGYKNYRIRLWQVAGSVAAGLMMTLYPLLSCRRQGQIRLALGLWRAHMPGPGYRKGCPLGHSYDSTNTYINPRGSRECRICRNRRRAESHEEV